MRVLVVGYGSMGQRHAKNATALGHAVIVYDPAVAALAYVHSLAEAVDATPNAVVIATPAATHADVAQELLTLGYGGPLFVEKPLATSLAEAAPFCAWPSAVLQVGYNWRFHSAVHAMRYTCREWLGAVRQAAFYVDADRDTWPGRDYADTLLECSHEIDTALHLLGPARCVEAETRGARWHLTLKHAQGATTQVTLDDSGAAATERGGYVNAGGSVHWRYRVGPDQRDALAESYRDELSHFLLDAQRGASFPPACDWVGGLQVLRIIAQARALTRVPA